MLSRLKDKYSIPEFTTILSMEKSKANKKDIKKINAD